MERRKCRCCGQPMTRLLTHEAGKWGACYTCLNCGCETATVTAKTESAAEEWLEKLMERADRAHEAALQSAKAPINPQPAEADRALKTYGLYCRLCETLTGKPIAKLDELLTAAKKAKRELAAYEGAGQRYEAEIARLKEMAAKDILRSGYPCDSCKNNTMDKDCSCGLECENHCVCYKCRENESFVWRGEK